MNSIFIDRKNFWCPQIYLNTIKTIIIAITK